jgi:hypothetical protein
MGDVEHAKHRLAVARHSSKPSRMVRPCSLELQAAFVCKRFKSSCLSPAVDVGTATGAGNTATWYGLWL